MALLFGATVSFAQKVTTKKVESVKQTEIPVAPATPTKPSDPATPTKKKVGSKTGTQGWMYDDIVMPDKPVNEKTTGKATKKTTTKNTLQTTKPVGKTVGGKKGTQGWMYDDIVMPDKPLNEGKTAEKQDVMKVK